MNERQGTAAEIDGGWDTPAPEPTDPESVPAPSGTRAVQAEPSSQRISKHDLPPPPAQLVSALAAFETAAPDSFRIGGASTAAQEVDVQTPGAGHPPAQPETDEATNASKSSSAHKVKIAALATGAVMFLGAVWALLVR
jgi:hypothetical protein